MSLIAIGLAATLSASPQASTLHPWNVEYYRSRAVAGAQCRYVNGSRAILMETSNPRAKVFVFLEQGYQLEDDRLVAPLTFDSHGQYRFEINGGLTSYHMLRLAVDDLLRQPRRPVGPRRFSAFMAAKSVPPCKRKTYEADLYDKE